MKNCHSCANNLGGINVDECRVLNGVDRDARMMVDAWLDKFRLNKRDNPPKSADGCPGYDPIFAPQTSWSTDRMDGSGNATNPSGIAADPSATVHHVYIPWNDTLIKGKP